MRHLRSFLLTGLALAIAAGSATAATTTYTDRGTWNLAVPVRTDLNFNSLSGAFVSSLTQGTSPDQVTFAGIGFTFFYDGTGYGPSGTGRYLTNDYYGSANAGLSATQSLSSVTGFGVDLWTFDNQAMPITVNVYNVGSPTPTTYTVNPVAVSNLSTSVTFFGYTSDLAVQKVEFTTTGSRPPNGRVILDNYSWGQLTGAPEPTETPESATLGYVGLGLLGLLLSKRKCL
ncbi:MAG TPA: hypothetical protein VM120_21485 [Bryobacteraceae bacterium]|nr:hypothetical protein [Bryobacteraceae bacterium]